MHLATGGRVVLGDRRPGDAPLPDDLRAALHEWGAVAATVVQSGAPDEYDVIRRRGRQLAARVAELHGRTVDYVDPFTGRSEPVEGGPTAPVPVLAIPPAEPTPWATGLPVAGFVAVFVAIADVTLSATFAEAFGPAWIPANLLVGAGLAPSIWLLRRTPFWRWPAVGAAAGLGAAWVMLMLGLLG